LCVLLPHSLPQMLFDVSIYASLMGKVNS